MKFDYFPNGGVDIEITVNKIWTKFSLSFLRDMTGGSEGPFEPIFIEHKDGNSRMSYDGEEVPEEEYQFETSDEEGLIIYIKAEADSPDFGAYVEVDIDYIGIYGFPRVLGQ